MKEKDLSVYDVYVTPNNQTFIKLSNDCSLSINNDIEVNNISTYIKNDSNTVVKIIGKLYLNDNNDNILSFDNRDKLYHIGYENDLSNMYLILEYLENKYDIRVEITLNNKYKWIYTIKTLNDNFLLFKNKDSYFSYNSRNESVIESINEILSLVILD